MLFGKLLDPHANVIEVGSNQGMHAVPIAQFIAKGKLFCFEPQRIVFQHLCCNITLNNLLNVYCYNQGVSDQCANTEIEASDYQTDWNYGSFSIDKGFSTEGEFAGEVHRETISLITLDSHPEIQKLTSLRLLKIDAEGFDLKVLAGAKQTIARHKPVIFIEVHSDSIISTKRYLESIDYCCYWFVSNRYQKNNFLGNSKEIKGVDTNFVCFHRTVVENNGVPDYLVAVNEATLDRVPIMQLG